MQWGPSYVYIYVHIYIYTSSSILDGQTDKQQCHDCCLRQERGGPAVLQFDVGDDTPAEVVRSHWFMSICRGFKTSRQIHCPGSARPWPQSGQWPWNIWDLCLPSGVSPRLICLWRTPTDVSSNLYRRTWMPEGRGRDSSLPALKSSRLETLRALLVAKGIFFFQEAAEMMAKCLHNSWILVYESHWAKFLWFCRLNGWNIFNITSHNFSSYLMHLFRDGLLPVTIISHCTSVASVLRNWKYDPAADLHIRLLIRGFRL